MVVILLGLGCTREFEPEPLESDLRYQPFGIVEELNQVFTLNKGGYIICRNDRYNNFGNELVKPTADNRSVEWKYSNEFRIKRLCELANGGYFLVKEGNYGSQQRICFTVLNDAGDIVYDYSFNDKLFPEQPQMDEFALSVQPDQDGGVYLLAGLRDNSNGYQDRYLIHIDRDNQVDQKVRLFSQFMYMTVEPNGQLYLLRTTSFEGYLMTLEASKVDMYQLEANNRLVPSWTYRFSSNEPDWKWWDYFPFQFKYLSGSVFILKQHLSKGVNINTGIDIIELNPADGSEISTGLIEFDVELDNYRDQSNFLALANANRFIVAYNMGFKSKAAIFDRKGSLIESFDLAGESGLSRVFGISYAGSRLALIGSAGLNRSPYSENYLFIKDIP